MNSLIVGAGNMGKAFIESFLKNNFLQPNQIAVVEKTETQQEEIKKIGITNVFSDFDDSITKQDIVILATKPQDAHIVYPQIKKYIQSSSIILSIMAGITIDDISQQLCTNRIVRCMPNLPCQLGVGVTGFFVSPAIEQVWVDVIEKMLVCTGIAIRLKEESELHSVTAISGSGPAYVFYFMQAMIEQAIRFGYNEQDATQMVAQTFDGAIQLFKKNNYTCEEWIRKVASKGGTTEAAIQSFDDSFVNNGVKEGLQAAFQRSIEMSKEK